MNILDKKSITIVLSSIVFSVSAQTNFIPKKGKLDEKDLKRWSHLDLQKDSLPGMSVDKTYSELIKDRKGTRVIVGIVDSGVDIEHEDLKGVIWTNKKEIPNNNIDDDKNGYIDDIHGWNFLGDITKENLEFERIANNKNLGTPEEYEVAKQKYDAKYGEAEGTKAQMEQMIKGITKADDILVKATGKAVYTKADLEALKAESPEVVQSKTIMIQMFAYEMPIAELKKEIQKELDKANATLSGGGYKDYRTKLGDNPNDIKDTKYGNANVMGPDKGEILHGTHVAGIVAQTRGNNIGGDGIANNVEILTVRAVPDGDEYDKDIALGIRYAVDNGAKVINGSFGKAFSPQKQWVYDAIKYAESKDVLIVHAAGNDAKNIDVEDNFPNDSDDKYTEFADNMITVGALSNTSELIASFSNFGTRNVDVFAPGVKIYATTPNNEYQYLQGTSMASPNVAGVAALIRSYFPNLTAKQVKHILMDSGTPINTEVPLGGKDYNQQPFSKLSVSGKIVNAYNAFQMAEKMSKNPTIKTTKIKG